MERDVRADGEQALRGDCTAQGDLAGSAESLRAGKTDCGKVRQGDLPIEGQAVDEADVAGKHWDGERGIERNSIEDVRRERAGAQRGIAGAGENDGMSERGV